MERWGAERLAAAFPTDLGWFAVAWRGAALTQVCFGFRNRRSALATLGDVSVVDLTALPDKGLVTRLQAYAAGEAVDFRDVTVDEAKTTEFRRRVRAACRAIPYGCTATYADLAAAAGSPQAARAVGQCMATNRVPIIVPCHRVVGSSGELGGFSAPGGTATKVRLLRLEGVEI